MARKKANDSASLFNQEKTTAETDRAAVSSPVPKTIRLDRFVENPDNPSTITDRAFERLIGKLERVPVGLTAKRIAYVTDHPAGEFVVLSGNKRLRVLKKIRGESFEAPVEWFQDVTEMTSEERREFIVTANVVEGHWVASLLVSIVPKDELGRLMDDADVSAILADLPSVQKIAANQEVSSTDFADTMELKIKLTQEDRDKAVRVLDAINSDDLGAAFMSLIDKGDK